MIEITNLHKRFGDKEVLKGIDLRIKKGEVIAIIGPSGTGKSTLLRCLNVLEKADNGHVKINGYSVDFSDLKKRDIQVLRERTAMVFQNSNLYRNKTAIENVMEPLVTTKQITKNEAMKMAEELLNKVGMLDKKDMYPETLSGGEKQRVGIARAMSVNSDILLFDEPTSALDPELVSEVLDVIKDLAKGKTTMLIVTHEMRFAQEVADEIIFMENGYIVEKAPPSIFFTNPKNERSREFIKIQSKESYIDIDSVNLDVPIDRRFTNSYKWKDLRSKDTDMEIYPMWVADMEFKASPAILKRLQDRVEDGILGYDTLSDSYYDAVSYWLDHRHSYKVSKDNILYSANSMVGLSVIIQAFTDKEDEILLNSPVYGNFFKTIVESDRKILESPLIEKNGRLTFDINDMESIVNDKTKILLICNPQNPTGTVWTKEELKELCQFCKKHNLYLVSDEVHYDFIFNNAVHTVAALVAEEMSVQTFTIISPGKSFNIAGVQSASIIIKDEEMRERFMEVMEGMNYPFAHAFAEAVTVGAYKESENWLYEVVEYIDENRKIFIKFIEENIQILKVTKSDSTYLMWVDCTDLKLSDQSLNELWQEKCKLILSHGSEFGSNYGQFRRFNIACQREKLIEILERIQKVFVHEGYIE